MSSPTKKHKTRRVAKLVKLGQKQKNLVRNRGTTGPDLALDKPNANEKKQQQAQKSTK